MKKKGLIISTIVMVVVLIAALTTSTYAWFSASAAVQVSDLTLQTKASDGLQIALKSGSNFFNGSVSYTPGTGWSSESTGWGQTLDFSSLGASEEGGTTTGIIAEASTYAVFTSNASGTWYLKTDTVGSRVWSTAIPEGYAGTKYNVAYNQVTTNGDPAENAVHVYSSKVDDITKLPTELTEDPENGHRLVIPIVVTPTADGLQTITCTIKVTYAAGTMANAALAPGMAAAGRIQVASGLIATAENPTIADPTITKTLYQPFDTYHLTASTQSIAANGSPAAGTIATTPTLTHTFEIALATASDTIAVGNIYQTTLTIWIEGQDSECDNLTAGSGFTIAIDYTFTKAEG